MAGRPRFFTTPPLTPCPLKAKAPPSMARPGKGADRQQHQKTRPVPGLSHPGSEIVEAMSTVYQTGQAGLGHGSQGFQQRRRVGRGALPGQTFQLADEPLLLA